MPISPPVTEQTTSVREQVQQTAQAGERLCGKTQPVENQKCQYDLGTVRKHETHR
ncbi:MAG: hypothetical protein RLN80_04560 [Rhodospirillales bacterium]